MIDLDYYIKNMLLKKSVMSLEEEPMKIKNFVWIITIDGRYFEETNFSLTVYQLGSY